MSQSQDFSQLPDDVPVSLKVQLLLQQGLRLAQGGEYRQAIAFYDLAVALQPDSWEAWYHCGVSLLCLGRYKQALSSYNKALDFKPDAWEASTDKGYVLSILGRHQEGLKSCEQALKINPASDRVWWHRGYILIALKRYKEALASCDKALEINPGNHEAWSARGIVLGFLNRRPEALASLLQAVNIKPDYYKAWYNRGLFLLRSGQNEAALASFEKALEVPSDFDELWPPQAWYACGYIQVRLGRYEEAIASFEQALAWRPNYPQAAFYKLIILIFTGRIFKDLGNQSKRRRLARELKVILNSSKYLLLGIFGLMLITNLTQIPARAAMKELFSLSFSLWMLALFVWELWKNKSNLSFVWQIYKRGILTYLRAFCIVLITLTSLSSITPIVPPALQWGWASAVFGNSGNIIFQPFNTIQKVKPAPALPENTVSDPLKQEDIVTPSVSKLETETVQPSLDEKTKIHPPQTGTFDYAALLTGVVWLLLIMLLPFWANLEEKIFRQGGNTWKQILFRSTLFGLVHIFVGIPIFAGFVLIIPGFLFACRYKYIHDRHFRANQDEKLAQEAGVEASTADHTIYNAMLITLVVVFMLI